MTDPVLQLVTQGVFVFAFVLTLVDYVRRPAVQRLELAILFGCLTPLIVLQLVSHIVIHEVGHHFGFSDDDMHALEDGAE